MTGLLEPTNEPYAIAKIAGIKLCESYNRQYGESHGTDYRCVMPNNLYGPGDNYHPENSHVIPGLIRRFHEAKLEGTDKVTVWGTGRPSRDFLFVDDLASACCDIMNVDKTEFVSVLKPPTIHLNVGYGSDLTITELAYLVAETVGYDGHIGFDSSKPDGTPQKLLDSSRIRSLGWTPKTGLREGLKRTYRAFLESSDQPRSREDG